MRFPFIVDFPSCGLVLSISFALCSIGLTQEIKPISPLAAQELQRRRVAVEEGQMLLLKGDEAYLAYLSSAEFLSSRVAGESGRADVAPA